MQIKFLFTLLILIDTYKSFSQDSLLINFLNGKGISIDKSNINGIDTLLNSGNDKVLYLSITSNTVSFIPYNSRGKYLFFINNKRIINFNRLENALLLTKGLIKKDSVFYYGGYSINTQNKGKYCIVKFFKDSSNIIFETEDYVYNESLDCESICGDGFLKLTIKDLNNDKIPDLEFAGSICIYCKGLEEGVSRLDSKAIKKNFVRYTYISNLNNNTSIVWVKSKNPHHE